MQDYSKETLFYPENSFLEITKTFEKLKSHILVPYILVGSLANRIIFPNYFSRLPVARFNDGDILFDYASSDEKSLGSDIKKDFYISHIYKEQTGYYFTVVDKENFIDFDLFASSPRKIHTQTVIFGNSEIQVCSEAEIFFKGAKDIYNALIKNEKLEKKHIDFYYYLLDSLDKDKLFQIWEEIFNEIPQNNSYSFKTLEEFIGRIDELIKNKSELIFTKDKATYEYFPYPVNCLENKPWGLEIEDQETYNMIVKKSGEKNI